MILTVWTATVGGKRLISVVVTLLEELDILLLFKIDQVVMWQITTTGRRSAFLCLRAKEVEVLNKDL